MGRDKRIFRPPKGKTESKCIGREGRTHDERVFTNSVTVLLDAVQATNSITHPKVSAHCA